VKAPASILELGLRHEEQISVRKVQNSVLAAQSKLIDTGYDVCPKCGTSSIKRDTRNLIFTLCLRIIKSGYRNINAVILSVIGKVLPQQPLCSAPIHPDLAKLQCEQGALYSYRQAQSNLEKLTVRRRSVNNHNNIKLLTTQVGAVLSQENLKTPAARDCAAPATAVIVR